MNSAPLPAWPPLPWGEWRETAQHLHLITQLIGKTRLALTPWLNHSWHVALYVTPRGLTTLPIPAGDAALQIDLDLIEHRVIFDHSSGQRIELPLGPSSIASFTGSYMHALGQLGVSPRFAPHPSEIPDAPAFADDHAERPYDGEAVRRFHRALLSVDKVLKTFRTGFLGKASPVHFFWGSFDLAASRFSGRTAPRHPGGMPALPDSVTCEAYSHEETSAGFWPGNDAFPEPAFYAYAYPAPDGFADAMVEPAAARFDAAMGEFVLPYEAVRTAPDPEAALIAFLESTHAAAADLAHWDRAALECPLGQPRQPRVVR